MGFALKEEVFLCFECGRRNRVPQGANHAAAKCGSCGKPLFPDISAKKERANKSEPKPAYTAVPNQYQMGIGLKIILGVVVLAGFMVFAQFYSDKPVPPKASRPITQNSVVPTQSLPDPVAQSPGIMWNMTGRQLQAPLRIETSAGVDYYVKLVDAMTGAEAVAIFVRGGIPLDVDVPLGSYFLKYASGQTWRGERPLFGPGDLTNYVKANSRFDFTVQGGYINGYTVELIRHPGGNLSTKSISPSEF